MIILFRGEMANREIIDYLKSGLKRGFSLEELRQNLLARGFFDYDINEAVKELEENKEEIKKPDKTFSFFSPKFVVYSSIGFFVLFMLTLFFILKTPSSTVILNEDLSEGFSVDMVQNKIEIELDDGKETMNLDFVEENSIDISFSDEEDSLEIGEEKEIDLDGDGVEDVSIKLESIVEGVPKLYFKKLEKIRERVENETILNFTEYEKLGGGEIEETEEVYEEGIIGNEGEIVEDENLTEEFDEEIYKLEFCKSKSDSSIEYFYFEKNDTHFCDDYINFISNEINCCNNSLVCCKSISNRAEIGLGCNGEFDCLDCGDNLDCFIENAETCSYSGFVHLVSLNLFGFIQNNSNYYELRGMDGDGCLLYTKYLEVNVEYSDELVNVLLEQGYSQEEINQKEVDANLQNDDLTENKESLCKYPIFDLLEMLNGWKENSFSGSSQDVEKYDCVGSFYEM